VYDRPYEDQVIKTMTVDMQGESFKEPEIIEE
ncbi:MAG: peptidylprolyl isomerase, partial [Clostridium butyricum]